MRYISTFQLQPSLFFSTGRAGVFFDKGDDVWCENVFELLRNHANAASFLQKFFKAEPFLMNQ
jgi:hypothetical protein